MLGAAALPLLMIGSTLVSAGAGYMQSRAAAGAANMERAQVENERNLARIEAIDAETERRQRLEQVLAAQSVQMATSGRDEGRSGSLAAIQRADRAQADKDIGQIRLMGATRDYRMQLESKGLKSQAKGAMLQGALGIGASLFGGGISAYRTWGAKPGQG
jgi:hypothetical protein